MQNNILLGLKHDLPSPKCIVCAITFLVTSKKKLFIGLRHLIGCTGDVWFYYFQSLK